MPLKSPLRRRRLPLVPILANEGDSSSRFLQRGRQPALALLELSDTIRRSTDAPLPVSFQLMNADTALFFHQRSAVPLRALFPVRLPPGRSKFPDPTPR